MKNYILSLLILTLLLASCRDKNKPQIPPIPNEDRTTLVYIIANNNLISNALYDINEMERGWDNSMGAKLYVFLNNTSNKNYLYEISHDTDMGKINSRIVKEYPVESDPCNATFFRSVVNEVRALAPAKSYGLFMWSHGKGWLPRGSSYPLRVGGSNYLSKIGIAEDAVEAPANYTIGANNKFNSEMELYTMAIALEGLKFDYIYFDACHMASIEGLYQLRSNADYIISSVAETLAAGAPYDKIISSIVAPMPQGAIGMAEEFFKFYNDQSGVMQSATISVVDTKKLEVMAAKLKAVVTYQPNVSYPNIQQFGRTYTALNNIFYDLTDFVEKTWRDTKPAQVEEFKQSVSDAVIYQAATQVLFNEIGVRTHCGLSVYIPRYTQMETLKTYRSNYSWAADSGLGAMVP